MPARTKFSGTIKHAAKPAQTKTIFVSTRKRRLGRSGLLGRGHLATFRFMPACPTCATPLVTMRQRDGLFFHCPTCNGRAVTLPQIRRAAGERLVTIGDNVEDYVGRWHYLLLILAATFIGDAVHLLAQPVSAVPCVGASGGISGVIVFYALQFPKARLGFLFRYFLYFRWVQMPAWFALLLWLLWQSAGVLMQLSGYSNVAATAHLGGAAAGFAFWFWFRRLDLQPAAGASCKTT